MKELFTALCKAQSEMGHARKDSKNPFFKSNYSDLASCIDASREVLTKNGLAVIQLVNGEELVTMLCHTSGESVSSTTPIICKDKTDAQKYIAAVTYMRRSSYQSIICQVSSDDDGNEATVSHKPTFAATPTPPPASRHFNLEATLLAFKNINVTKEQLEGELGKPASQFNEADSKELKELYQRLKSMS